MNAREQFLPQMIGTQNRFVVENCCDVLDELRGHCQRQREAIDHLMSIISNLESRLDIAIDHFQRPLHLPALPREGSVVQEVDSGRVQGWENGHWVDVEGEDVEWLGTAQWRGSTADYIANSAAINHELAQGFAEMLRAAETPERTLKLERNDQKETK